MAPKSAQSAVPAFLRDAQRVPLGRSGHFAEVDVNRLSTDVLAHVFAYGLRQILNDAAASGTTVDEKVALFNKKLEALYSGALRAQRAAASPLERLCREIATDYGRTKGLGGDKLKAFVEKARTADAVVHLAQKRLAEAEALGDLGLGDDMADDAEA